MNNIDKSKDELLAELESLQLEYNTLKDLYSKDISNVRLAEEKLQDEQLFSNALLDNIPGIFYLYSYPEFKLIRWNKRYEVLLGYEPGEMQDHYILDWQIPDAKESFLQTANKVIEEGHATIEAQLLTKNGSAIPFLMTGVRLERSGQTYIMGIGTDISELKKTEEVLLASELRYRSILNASPDDITIADMQGRIVMVSPAAMPIFGGNNVDEALGHSVFEYLIPEDRERAANNVALRVNGLITGPSEYHGLRTDGSIIDIEVNTDFIRNKTGIPTQMVLIIRDISERKKSELILQQRTNELAELNASKDKFFSIIAHDLKSPFTGFLGLTKVMVEDIQELSIKDMHEFSICLQKSAKNLYSLLENLLEWSCMQRGVTEFNLKSCNIKSFVEQNIEIMTEFASQKNIEIVDNIPKMMEVNADHQMIKSVFRNLISNAIKFTPRGGRIELGVLPDGTNKFEVSFYIKDNGLGMDSVTLGKLFKIDQKVSRPGTEGELSSGLGLLLCKEFIEKHGGRIWVVSEEGKGSTFYFTLLKDLQPNQG